ncbi:MAG: flagellar assembly protein FliW [Nitrospirales bacterium]
MKISTSRFGELEVPEESIISFPTGLVGLPHHTRYVVFDVDRDSGYQWLQSLEDETLAVVITHADLIQADFEAQLTDDNVKELNIMPNDQVEIVVIVTIPSGRPDQATANLRAPIVVNLRTRVGKQIILHESIPLQVPLFAEEPSEAVEDSVCVQEVVKTS